jgi:hypothetical protein
MGLEAEARRVVTRSQGDEETRLRRSEKGGPNSPTEKSSVELAK